MATSVSRKRRQACCCSVTRTGVDIFTSDVLRDDPSIIGSGPTIPDGTKFEDAASVLVKYGIDKPEAVISQLNEGKITPPDPKAPCFGAAIILGVSNAPDGLWRRLQSWLRNEELIH